MANMSYCRFQNTLQDLNDINEHIEFDGDLSEEEKKARLRLIKLCVEIALDFGDEVGKEITEVD